MMTKPTYDDLIDMLCHALPYVEEAESDPIYSERGKASTRALARSMRKAINLAELDKTLAEMGC